MAAEQSTTRDGEARADNRGSRTENDFERDEEAALAEDLLFASASGDQLVEAEGVLETIEAQEAQVEALAVAESGTGEPLPGQFAAEDDAQLRLDDVVRLRLMGRLDEDRSFAGYLELDLQPGPRTGEFVCSECRLTRLRSQLADSVRILCRDCAHDTR